MSLKIHFTLYSLLLLVPISAIGQFRLYGAPRASSASMSEARVKSTTPLDLPFWDDFSWAQTDKPDSLWMNSETVFVNAGNGVKAPSINVATFDGLNQNGIPYKTSPSEYLAFGYTDSLISRPIKLASNVPSINNRDSVFLSFFYQWSGNAEAPDKRDFLEVELLNNQSKWISVAKFETNAGLVPDVFYDTMIKISNDQFFHDNFQFRFRSFGRQSGYYDIWNVDYVYLDKGRSRSVRSFPDKAVGSKITPIFVGQYYASPIEHFFKDPVNNIALPSFYISNNIGGDQPRPTYYYVDLGVEAWDSDGSTTTSTQRILTKEQVFPDPNVLEKKLVTFNSLPVGLSPFSTYDSLLKIDLIIHIDSGEQEAQVLSAFPQRIQNLPYLVNGVTSQTYELSNYYAYDDGTAEATVGAAQSGNQIAVRFDMLTDDPSKKEQDTLVAVQIYFAHHGADNPSSVYLLVMGTDDNGLPKLLYEQPISASQQPLNTLVSYQLEQAVVVPDTFFIGWRETTPNKTARIGFDKSNDTGNKIYVNTNGTWFPTSQVSGSVMIRPVFGTGDIITGVVDTERTQVSFYPNPNRGEFYFSAPIDQLSIFSVTGQPVDFTLHDEAERTRVSLNQPGSGLYLVKYHIGRAVQVDKILVHD